MEDFQKLLTERLQVLVSASFIFFLFLLVAWNNGYFSFARQGKALRDKIPNKMFLGVFGFFLLLQLLVIPLSFKFWYYFYTLGDTSSFHLSSEMQGWINIYGIFITAIGMLFFFLALPATSQKVVMGDYAKQGWKAKFQDFFIAGISWILSYPLVIAIGQFVAILLMVTYQNIEPEQVAVRQIKMASTSNVLLSVLIFCVIFIVPAIEELLFRGFFQNWLKNFMSSYKSIALTSTIFAIFHFSFSQGMGNVELIISLFVLSCFLGFIYERQKSLWAPIFLHAIFNAISIMMILYMESVGI